mgnify:CR=1 FL=1
MTSKVVVTGLLSLCCCACTGVAHQEVIRDDISRNEYLISCPDPGSACMNLARKDCPKGYVELSLDRRDERTRLLIACPVAIIAQSASPASDYNSRGWGQFACIIAKGKYC